MKKFSLIKSLMLVCLWCIGMGAWGADADYTLNPSAGSNNSYTGNCDVTVDGITWNVTGNAQMTPWRLGGKSITRVDRVVYSKTAYTSAVSKIDLTVGAASSITVNSLKLVYSTNSDFSSPSEISKSFTANSTISFEGDFPANAYYKFIFNVTVSGSNNKFVEFSKVEFFNKTTSGGGSTVTAPTFDVAAGTYTEDKLVHVNNYNGDYHYAYTTDGSAPAFDAGLNVTNGTEYDNNEGIAITSSCTLKVIAVDGDGNKSSVTSAAYVINKPQVFASLAELVAADLASGTNVTVSFENVPIKAFQTISSTRKGVYFDIQKGGNDIEIYFNSAIPAEWAVGGTLSGTLTACPWNLYSSTWELAPAAGWAWTNLTYNASAVLTAPAITTQPASANYEFNGTAQNLRVVATGNPAPTYQWYSNTTSSNENGTELDGETNVTYAPSTATAGTFYYYCVVTNSEGSATSDVATITVSVPKVASLPFNFDGGKSDIASIDGMSQTGLGTDYSSSPKLKFDSQGDYVVINFNEAAKKVTYTLKGNSLSGSYAFDVQESADGISFTNVEHITSLTDGARTKNLSNNSRYVKFIYTTKDNGNVALGKISIISASVLDNPELAFGESTYSFFTGDNKQVVATSKAGSAGTITYALTSGDENAFAIDENTGDIVCETAGTYTVTATIEEAAGFASGTTTCTVKIKESVVGNSIIVAETDGGYYAMTTTNSETFFESKAIKKAGSKYVVSSLDDILFYTNTTDGKTTIQSTSNSEYLQATDAKKVSYTDNEYKWTNDGEKLTAAVGSHGTLQYNTSNPRFTTYGTKVGQYATIVDLSNVVVGDVVTLNAACTDGDFVYGTYSNTSAWEVPAELIVYEVRVVDDELYTEAYRTSDVVPANTGVLVCAEEGGDFVISYETDPEVLALAESVLGEDNLLRPTGNGITAAAMAEADADCEFFRLTMHNGTQCGFWWGAEDGASFALGANKSYLAVPESAAAKVRGFILGGDATGIKTVNNNAENNAIYNLAGQRVSRAEKGIYIKNGKKYIVK